MNNWLPLIIFITSMVVGWRSPRSAVWLAVITIPTYIIKMDIGFLPTTVAEMILLGAFVGWLAYSPIIRLKELGKTYIPIILPLILLAVGLIVGTLASSDLRLSLGIVKGWFINPIILYGMVVAIFQLKNSSSLLNALIFSTLPLSIYALIQVATGDFITVDHRASAWFGSANYLSLYLVPILLLSTYWLFEKTTLSQRIWFWVSGGLGILAVYFSFSYGGWLALIAGGLVLGIYHFRYQWKFWLTGGVLLALAVATQATSERVARMINLATQSSASVRLQVWATDWLMAQKNWLTGIGLGQYPLRYPEVVSKLYSHPLENEMLHAHNLYFQFLLNLGVVGFAGFVWLVIKGFELIKNASLSWVAPLFAAIVAILIHGLVDTPYWKNDLSALFWVILALAVVNNRNKSSSQND